MFYFKELQYLQLKAVYTLAGWGKVDLELIYVYNSLTLFVYIACSFLCIESVTSHSVWHVASNYQWKAQINKLSRIALLILRSNL